MIWGVKKTLFPEKQNRPDVIIKRANWQKIMWHKFLKRLRFIDESGIDCALTRLYGRAPKNERVKDYVPDCRFKRKSVLACLGMEREIVSLLYDGTLDGKLFLQYIEEFLAPTLLHGDIVVMDNATPHKVKGVREAIEARGAKAWYLPVYSPDFNPVELLWTKVKAFLKKMKARTDEALEKALELALNSVGKSDLANWFNHCGYY